MRLAGQIVVCCCESARCNVRSVVITGVGFVTPLGTCQGEHHSKLVAAHKTGGSVPIGRCVGDELLKDHLSGRNLRPLDRTSRLLAVAAGNALSDSGIDPRHEPVGLVSGTMFSSAATIAAFDCRAMEEGPAYASALDFANSVINASTGQTAIWHTLEAENTTIATGQSSGLKAIVRARESVGMHRAEVLLAGGVEEYSEELSRAFDDSGLTSADEHAVPFGADRSGFVLREAAALLVIEDEVHAKARHANIHGWIIGAGSAFDCDSRKSVPASVSAIERGMRLAIDEAGIQPTEVDLVVSSANGSLETDDHERRAIEAAFGPRQVPTLAPKILHGECNGAGGPLQLTALLYATAARCIPTMDGSTLRQVRTVLVNSVSFDGHSCSLVVRLPIGPEQN